MRSNYLDLRAVENYISIVIRVLRFFNSEKLFNENMDYSGL